MRLRGLCSEAPHATCHLRSASRILSAADTARLCRPPGLPRAALPPPQGHVQVYPGRGVSTSLSTRKTVENTRFPRHPDTPFHAPGPTWVSHGRIRHLTSITEGCCLGFAFSSPFLFLNPPFLANEESDCSAGRKGCLPPPAAPPAPCQAVLTSNGG